MKPHAGTCHDHDDRCRYTDVFACEGCDFEVRVECSDDFRLIELQHQVEILQSQILVITAELSQ